MVFRSCAATLCAAAVTRSPMCSHRITKRRSVAGHVRLSDRRVALHSGKLVGAVGADFRPRKRGTQNINSQLARNDAHEPGLARGTTLVARTAAWPRHGLEEEASWPRGIVPYSSRRTARHLAGGYETSHIHSPLSVGSPTP